MARVARQLGSSTMALIRYVASKDELLLLMSDAAVGPPPALPARRSWRTRLQQWALAVRDVWWRRPWLLELPVEGRHRAAATCCGSTPGSPPSTAHG